MKILYICTDYGIPILGRKGASIHIRELTDAFHAAGHNVVIASPLAHKSHWEAAEVPAANFLHLPISNELLTSVHAVRQYTEEMGAATSLHGDLRKILYNVEIEPRLIQKFKNNPPDLVYVRASVFSAVGVQIARHFDVPLFVEVNAPLALEQSTYRDTGLTELAAVAEKALISAADKVFIVSDNLRSHVSGLGARVSAVATIPNGVNPAKFFPKGKNIQLKNKYGLSNGPVIGFVGGLRPWHGVQYFPEVMEKLVKRFTDLTLLIVGDGPLKKDLEYKFEVRNLASHVVFADSIAHDSVPDMIRLFDVALAPYPVLEHEFYFSPLKIFEYMACGVPTVAARVGQISQLIQDKENGFTYNAGDLVEMAAIIESILTDAELAAAIGRRAARMIHTTYTWDMNVRRIMEFAAEFAC